jgi:hypothetical protein
VPSGTVTALPVTATTLRVLVLADPNPRRPPPQIEGFTFRAFADLTQDLLDGLSPDVILSPLIVLQFDASDVIARLCALGFRGRYRAVSAPLPRPDAVRDEIRNHGPGVDFDIFELSWP